MPEPTDEELNAYIRTRLALLGVDLDVLPEDDPEAPVDRRTIFEQTRRFLRTTVPAVSGFPIDPQEVPPALYPAAVLGPDALPAIPEKR